MTNTQANVKTWNHYRSLGWTFAASSDDETQLCFYRRTEPDGDEWECHVTSSWGVIIGELKGTLHGEMMATAFGFEV